MPQVWLRIIRRMSNPWLYPGSPVLGIHYDEVETFLDQLETTDAINDEISAIRFTLVEDGIKNFFNRYQAKDIVELWINDGFNGASYPTEAHRCFVGRIDKITPRLTHSGWKVEVDARDYLADLMEMEAFILYYDGTPDEILVDLVAQLNTQRGSLSNSNIVNAQPRFELSYDSLDALTSQDQYFINSQSYFDAIASLASTYGKTLKLSYSNFHPLLYWDAFIGNKITINVKIPQAVGDLSWGITEGQNMAEGSTARNIQGSKTRIRLYSIDANGTPIFVDKEATTAGLGRTLQLGTDRYGEINNWTDVSDSSRAWPLANAIGDALIAKLSKVRREYQFKVYPGRIDVAKKQAGNKVLVLAPSIDIPGPGESLEVIQAKHRWGDKGLETSLQLANYNPAFHRLLCPPSKKTLDKALAEVYSGFRIYYLERAYFSDALTHEVSCWSYNPHDANSRRFEFFLPNSGLGLVEEGDGAGALSSWVITHPEVAQTFRYVVEKSATLYRISLYNEGDFGAPAGYLVAQSVWQVTNTTFTLVAQGGWGVSGTVYFTGTAALNSFNQRLNYGFDADNTSNVVWMGYHRGFLYILRCRACDGLTHVMFKFTLAGSLVATWNIGLIADGTAANRLVHSVSILGESDAPAFVFHVPFGWIRIANWNTALFSPIRVVGPDIDESVSANCWPFTHWGPMTYIGSDQYLIWASLQKATGTYLNYYMQTFSTKNINDSGFFPRTDLSPLETVNADLQPMARIGKQIYSTIPTVGGSDRDQASMAFDFNGGIWYMRTRENNANINANRLTKWGLDGKVPINYLDFASHGPIDGVPRAITVVPVRKEKQL